MTARMEKVREALDITMMGNFGRAEALAEVEEWEARLRDLETQGITDALNLRDTELEATEVERDRLREALALLVAAVEPLMASKPVELMENGLMRYDWTDALYAIQACIGDARAALAAVGGVG